MRLGEKPTHMWRKIWEFCYVAQALAERGMLRPGCRGLGFAVGQEPLPAMFASLGCEIVATDMPTELDADRAWIDTGQHASSLEALNTRGICPPEVFRSNVSFCAVDMRQLPVDLGQYDFVWSSCAAEHLGSIALGRAYLVNAVKYLKPGGVAVHTIEYNVSSRRHTIDNNSTILFRRRDIRAIGRELRRSGYRVDLSFRGGHLPADRYVDRPPYTMDVHLKLELAGFTLTSYGLIIEKPAAAGGRTAE